jgi:hypothetical protein
MQSDDRLREAAEFMASLWHGIAGVCWLDDDLDDFWDQDWQDTSSPYRSRPRSWWCDEFGTVMTSHPSRRLEDGRWSGFERGCWESTEAGRGTVLRCTRADKRGRCDGGIRQRPGLRPETTRALRSPKAPRVGGAPGTEAKSTGK